MTQIGRENARMYDASGHPRPATRKSTGPPPTSRTVQGMLCVEDLVHELTTSGEYFQVVTMMWHHTS